MVAVILGSAIVFLDTSIVNLANPTIAKELDSALFGKLEAQSYVTNAYFLTLSSLLILAGALSDYHGRKKMFGIGLIGFLITSALCGLAPSMEVLIGARVFQGAAGALVVPAPTPVQPSPKPLAQPVRPPTRRRLALRSRAEIASIQGALKLLNCHPGPIDGVIGSLTRAAIATFQFSEGLPSDGELTSETEQRLQARMRASDEPRPQHRKP